MVTGHGPLERAVRLWLPVGFFLFLALFPFYWMAITSIKPNAELYNRNIMAVDVTGAIVAIDIDDLTGIGPYSVYPRTSAVEGNQVVNLVGGPYDFANFRAKTTVVFQNKTPTCQYRAVGHPIATAITEGLVDLAAEALDLDPAEFRRRNLMRDNSYPRSSPAGMLPAGLPAELKRKILIDNAFATYPRLGRSPWRSRSKPTSIAPARSSVGVVRSGAMVTYRGRDVRRHPPCSRPRKWPTPPSASSPSIRRWPTAAAPSATRCRSMICPPGPLPAIAC